MLPPVKEIFGDVSIVHHPLRALCFSLVCLKILHGALLMFYFYSALLFVYLFIQQMPTFLHPHPQLSGPC